jgi:hypothetical protein
VTVFEQTYHSLMFALRNSVLCVGVAQDSGAMEPAQLPDSGKSGALVYNMGCSLGAGVSLVVLLNQVAVWTNVAPMGRGEPLEFAVGTYIVDAFAATSGSNQQMMGALASSPTGVSAFAFASETVYRIYFARMGSSDPTACIELMASASTPLVADLPRDGAIPGTYGIASWITTHALETGLIAGAICCKFGVCMCV